MGEVYKAHDPRLQRDVAIKTSAQRFSERFQIEARAIAALNHPNICQIYDVGPNYIVMEYVEGVSPKGPLSVDETLKLANQIASALEEAHSKKITHRDLKPGNILVKADGTVKVLDFGLAKFGVSDTTVSIGEDSPTLTMAATQAGVILGTAHYMSPEQARGKPVDTRADIWSFGVILFELTTGAKPFTGEDLADTLATVVKIDPDFTRVPARVRRLVQACLQKDPQQRLQAIGDMRLALADDTAPASEPVVIEVKPKVPWLWPAVAALFAIAAGVTAWMWRTAPLPELQSVQCALSAPPDEIFANTLGAFGVSPDGRYVVFAARGKNGGALWVRPVDSMQARPLAGTASQTPPNFPFWSPDSKSVAFTDRAENKLKRVEIVGGAALTLADVPPESPITHTGAWSKDGVILFGSSAGIQRTSASGGGATLLTKVDPKKESAHGYPQFLPDGKRFLYLVTSEDANVQGIYASSLDAPQQRTLIVRTNAKAVYVPPKGEAPGYLLWMQDDNLVAQRFNVDKLEREGDPLSVAENIPRNTANPVRAGYWASDAGLLVYLQGDVANLKRRIVWMSRDGKLLGDALPEADIQGPQLSPDGTRLAIWRREGAEPEDIGVWEFARSVATRLTFEKETEAVPVWSPDSKQIAYLVQGKGLYRKDASGAGQAELLLQDAGQGSPMDWSRDGKFLLYRTLSSSTGRDLWALPLADGKPDGKPFAVLAAPFDQSSARFSPDGKWISYSSNESGKAEVFIQPFVPPGSSNGPGGRWQVSNAGGGDMAWRGDGKELYYETDEGDIMAAAIREAPREEGGGLKVDAPKLLFKAGSDSAQIHSFDAARDGQKFVVQLPATATGGGFTTLTVVTNWQAALRK
jgi:Tol biopolymer transport system component